MEKFTRKNIIELLISLMNDGILNSQQSKEQTDKQVDFIEKSCKC